MDNIETMRPDWKKGFVTGAAEETGKCTALSFSEARSGMITENAFFQQ